MDDDELEPTGGEGTSGDDGSAGAASTPASTALPPAAVLNSPEYKALVKEHRKLARQLGTANAAADAARQAAEQARLAAEAQQQAVVDAEMTALLGEEGVAFWAEFAELSTTDPVAAARRLAEFRAAGAAAQSAAAGAGDAAAGTQAAGEGSTVPAQTPPPPAAGVDGGAALGAAAARQPTAEDVAAGLEKTFNDVVARVQDPLTRNRVTMKERAAGAIAFVAAAYTRAVGTEPRDVRSR